MFKLYKILIDRYLNATYAFFLCIALTLGATYFAYRSSQLEKLGRFERSVINITNALRNRMTVYTNSLLYARNLFIIKPDLTEEDFTSSVNAMHLQENFPGIQSIGYIERLTREQAILRLKRINKTLVDAGTPDRSNEIDIALYVERLLENNAPVLGLDLGASPPRKRAMDEARDLGVAVATDRVYPLNGKAPPLSSFFVFLPRYKKSGDISTVEGRRKALLGFVYAGFRATNLFSRISGDVRMHSSNFAIRIYDGHGTAVERLMFSEGDFNDIDSNLNRVVEFTEANHTWTIEIAAQKGFGLAYLRWSPFFVLAFGFMLSFAVMASLLRSDRFAARLKVAREEAESANKAKSLFLANMSHEIRTPLGVIIGFAELAQGEADPELRNSYLKTLLRSGKELGRIIGEVLDLSKIEAKALLIECSAFSLKELHEEIKETWAVQAKEKGLEFTFQQAEDLPEFIESDRTRIQQILVNLLSNAFKFTAQGTVRVTVAPSEDKRFLVYAVDDTGIGIRDENKGRLFKAFSQGDSSVTRKFGGSGLGLAIAKELSQALGGDLTLEASTLDQGSRFVLKLPLVPAPGLTQRRAPVTSEEVLLRGRKILLVEDSIDNQYLIEHMFKKYAVALTITKNGQEGVDQALTQAFDLILMDIQMPVLDGYGAFEKLKSVGVRTPVIALTANALRDEREKALRLGFSAYLTKPIDRAQLIRVSAQMMKVDLQ